MTERKKAEKLMIINAHQMHKNDTGSSKIQIALLAREIANLQEHCINNKKDFDAIKQLKMRAHKIKKLTAYLERIS